MSNFLNYFLNYYNLNRLNNIKYERAKITHVVCPQFLLLPTLLKFLKKNSFFLGCQDLHHHESGSFTGDTSIELIKKFKCKYAIIGHSERRNYHNESNETVNSKLLLASKNLIRPILCVGESINLRKKRIYKEFILKQLNECIQKNCFHEIIFAFQPIWSLGTGLIPSADDISEISNLIFSFLKKKKIPKFKILYGGSVSSSNFKQIMATDKINGLLIGGASLKINEIKKILTNC